MRFMILLCAAMAGAACSSTSGSATGGDAGAKLDAAASDGSTGDAASGDAASADACVRADKPICRNDPSHRVMDMPLCEALIHDAQCGVLLSAVYDCHAAKGSAACASDGTFDEATANMTVCGKEARAYIQCSSQANDAGADDAATD